MGRDAIRYTRWKVFCDGVEVPWVSFSVTAQRRAGLSAVVMLEPDALLRKIRPGTKVLFAFYDHSDTALSPPDGGTSEDVVAEARNILSDFELMPDVLRRFKVYAEGEVTGRTYSKTPDSRNILLPVVGELDAALRTPMFAMGLGTQFRSPLTSGSFVFPEAFTIGSDAQGGDRGVDTLLKVFLASAVGDDAPSAAVAGSPLLKNGFAARIFRLLAWLCRLNAGIRLRTVRDRLVNKITGIDDSLLDRLIASGFGTGFMADMQNGVSEEMTVGGAVQVLMDFVRYYLCPQTAPYFPDNDKQPAITAIQAPGEKDKSIHALYRTWVRHDNVLLPETYYAMPPRCNILFPDDVKGADIRRDYMSEPTRTIMYDRTLGASAAGYMAPSNPTRADIPNLSVDRLGGTVLEAIKTPTGTPPSSPYESVSGRPDGDSYNLLMSIRDMEIEKGVVVNVEDSPHDSLASYATLLSGALTAEDKTKALAAASADASAFLTDASKTPNTADGKYVGTMVQLARFKHDLARSARGAEVALRGQRFLALGFPALILDEDMTHTGVVDKHTLQVDTSGNETSMVSFANARELPIDAAREVAAAKEAAEDAQREQALDQRRKYYGQVLADNAARVRTAGGLALTTGAALTGSAITTFRGLTAQTLPLFTLIRGRISTYPLATFTVPFLESAIDVDWRSRFGSQTSIVDILLRVDHVLAEAVSGAANNFAGVSWGPEISQTRMAALRDALTAVDLYTQAQVDLLEQTQDPNQTDPLQDSSVLGPSDQVASSQEMAVLLDNGDLPTPPPHFPIEMLYGDSLDRVYADMLGVTPLWGGSNVPRGYTEQQRRSPQRLKAELVRMLSIVNETVFPIFGDKQGSTEWERRSRPGLDKPVADWIDEQFHWRKAMSLGEYIERNGLEAVFLTGPEAQQFVNLRPAAAPTAGGYDNTPLSKLVDEWEMLPAGVAPAASDPKMSEVREDTVKTGGAKFLRTADRQAMWIAYAKRHFGGRSFSGR